MICATAGLLYCLLGAQYFAKMLVLCIPLPDALPHVANARFVAILIFDRSGVVILVICWVRLLQPVQNNLSLSSEAALGGTLETISMNALALRSQFLTLQAASPST